MERHAKSELACSEGPLTPRVAGLNSDLFRLRQFNPLLAPSDMPMLENVVINVWQLFGAKY